MLAIRNPLKLVISYSYYSHSAVIAYYEFYIITCYFSCYIKTTSDFLNGVDQLSSYITYYYVYIIIMIEAPILNC